jgi:hypothetical protein
MAWALSEHVPPSQTPQLLMDEGEEFFQGRVFPLTPRLQEPGDVLGRGCRHRLILMRRLLKGPEVG